MVDFDDPGFSENFSMLIIGYFAALCFNATLCVCVKASSWRD